MSYNMNEPKEISSLQIIIKGQIMVNIPVTVAIILASYIFYQLGLGWTPSILIGTGVGWFVWGKLLDKWKLWAFERGVDRERLFKLGKLGLINFYRYRIFDKEPEDK